MKIQNLLTINVTAEREIERSPTATIANSEIASERNTLYPEIDYLLKAYSGNWFFNCRFLGRDETNLAHYIIATLLHDPDYIPSTSIVDAIRSIGAKLELDTPIGP